jgi:hypothetical protein
MFSLLQVITACNFVDYTLLIYRYYLGVDLDSSHPQTFLVSDSALILQEESTPVPAKELTLMSFLFCLFHSLYLYFYLFPCLAAVRPVCFIFWIHAHKLALISLCHLIFKVFFEFTLRRGSATLQLVTIVHS